MQMKAPFSSSANYDITFVWSERGNTPIHQKGDLLLCKYCRSVGGPITVLINSAMQCLFERTDTAIWFKIQTSFFPFRLIAPVSYALFLL